MTDNKRNQKKEKENLCPRFKQHQKKGCSEKDDIIKGNKGSKRGTSVVTFSSNLSRNVVSNVNSQESVIIKRTDAVSKSRTFSQPLIGQKVTNLVSSELPKQDIPSLKPASFEPGPPPAKNSLHRLSKKSRSCAVRARQIRLQFRRSRFEIS